MRNKVIFNDGNATFKDSFSLIFYRLSNRLKSADKFFTATDTTLIMRPEGIIAIMMFFFGYVSVGFFSFCVCLLFL
jgi:hypothetical protein